MRGTGEWRRDLKEFGAKNRQLIWLLGLFLAGVEIGCLVFRGASGPLGQVLAPLLALPSPVDGMGDAVRSMIGSCGPALLLLLILFLAGFSACGAPLALAVPPFFGMGVGLSEAYYYARLTDGVRYVALFYMPHALLILIALLIGCSGAVKMSVQLCRQLLPRKSIGGDLWREVKMYAARFLLAAGLIFAAGAVDAVLRLLFL